MIQCVTSVVVRLSGEPQSVCVFAHLVPPSFIQPASKGCDCSVCQAYCSIICIFRILFYGDRENSVLRINPFGGSTFYLDRAEVCVECGPDERGEFPRSRAVKVIRTELFLRFRKSLREVFFPLVALFGGKRVVRRDRTVL